MYADNSQAYKHFSPPDLSRTVLSIQSCFADISRWTDSNMLKLNAEKTEIIILGSKFTLSKVRLTSLNLEGCTIQLSQVVRNLGVLLDSELTFKQHCLQLSSSSFYHLRQIWQIRHFLTQAACETLVHAFITARLDYCNSILAGCNKTTLNTLQLVQNAAARLVVKARKRDHITPVLRELHWLSIAERVMFKIAVLVYRCLHHTAPMYLQLTRVSELPSRRSLRSSAHGDLLCPRPRTTTYSRKSFFFLGPQIWNKLPVQLRSSTSIGTFKTDLKTFMFTSPFPLCF